MPEKLHYYLLSVAVLIKNLLIPIQFEVEEKEHFFASLNTWETSPIVMEHKIISFYLKYSFPALQIGHR